MAMEVHLETKAPDKGLCFFLASRENNSHLFLHCPITGQLWQLFLNLVGLRWSMPATNCDLLKCWNYNGGAVRQKKWWKLVPTCIWWTIWNERNYKKFEDKSNPMQKVKLNCILLFIFWCKENYVEETESLVDMIGSFCKFPILPVIDGVVKPCNYSELENITNFETCLIQYTKSGRLFRGTITEGSETRSVIVETWDFLLPLDRAYAYRPSKFCDEIELYETTNVHPHLAKLSRYCCDRRLEVVYDEELTTLHKKKIAVGSITASCIMIDKEVNIKVFDFGYICNRVNEDSVIPLDYVVGRYPEDVSKGMFTYTPSSSSLMFHIIHQSFPIIVCLITKMKLGSNPSVLDNCKPGSFVHKCFEDVDDQTVSDITLLT
ncbi:hypothetical protein H5410_015686 [Solanum commersonii]|uniref:Uncharacterized protein n=1 Tax=Solanum commersonii TaxID=4109 RepID=A0A9J5ZUD1_SOLCO|nr:hypothetical protein H5410_015686 [Solanum commersonii]